MQIDLCSPDIAVSHQVLDGADVGTRLQQMRGKRVPESMRSYPFGQTRFGRRAFDRTLQSRVAEMMPAADARGCVQAGGFCGKQPLPFPTDSGLGIFLGQPFGQPHTGDRRRLIRHPQFMQTSHVDLQLPDQFFWQDRHAVLVALAPEDLQALSRQVEMMHPQAQPSAAD